MNHPDEALATDAPAPDAMELDDGRHPKSFRLNRRRFSVGLVWMTADDPATVARQARSEASHKNIGADLYVTRVNDAGAQFGLGRKAEGLFPGSVAAAAVVGDKVKDSFVGCFAIDGGWWFVCQRDDLILPDGDCFYDDEDRARARFEAALDEGGWKIVFAPAEWMEQADHTPAAELLAMARGPRVRAVNPLTGYLAPILASMLAAAVLFLGVQLYMSWQENQDREEALRLAKIRLELERKQQAAQTVESPPWPEIASVSDALAACAQGMAFVQPDTPGWALVGSGCERRGMNLWQARWEWERLYGTVAWLEDWLRISYGDDLAAATVFQATGDEAYATRGLAAPAPRGPEELLDERRAVLDLLTASQSVGAEPTIGPVRRPTPPDGIDPEDWTPPGFAPLTWEIKTWTLDGWGQRLERIPGLVLNTVRFDAEENGYTLKGDLYVKF
jgi:hypothetical protein